MLKKIITFIIHTVLWILLLIAGFVLVIWLLCGCGTPNNLGGSYTRLYPVTSYEIGSQYFKATYTLENGNEGELQARISHVYFHEGEDTLVVISSDEYGEGLVGVKEFYLYLNSEKAKEYLGNQIDSIVENGS